MPAAREMLLLDHTRQPAVTKAIWEATEMPLAAADPHPGRCWKPLETASIRAGDTVRAGPLLVRHGDAADPRFLPPDRAADRRAASTIGEVNAEDGPAPDSPSPVEGTVPACRRNGIPAKGSVNSPAKMPAI